MKNNQLDVFYVAVILILIWIEIYIHKRIYIFYKIKERNRSLK